MTDQSRKLRGTLAARPERPANQAERDWTRVRTELANPRWRFRSTEGIAAASGLQPKVVKRTLAAHRSEIRAIFARSQHFDGVRQVYTLGSRKRTLREVVVDVAAFASR